MVVCQVTDNSTSDGLYSTVVGLASSESCVVENEQPPLLEIVVERQGSECTIIGTLASTRLVYIHCFTIEVCFHEANELSAIFPAY